MNEWDFEKIHKVRRVSFSGAASGEEKCPEESLRCEVHILRCEVRFAMSAEIFYIYLKLIFFEKMIEHDLLVKETTFFFKTAKERKNGRF